MASSQLEGLPSELLIEIVKYCAKQQLSEWQIYNARKDGPLYMLSLTSRHIRAHMVPFLVQSLRYESSLIESNVLKFIRKAHKYSHLNQHVRTLNFVTRGSDHSKAVPVKSYDRLAGTFQSFTNLRKLNFQPTHWTGDVGEEFVSKMRELNKTSFPTVKELCTCGCCTDILSGCPTLEKLSLSQCINDHQLRATKDMKTVTSLSIGLSYWRTGPTTMQVIQQSFPNLRELHVTAFPSVDEKGLFRALSALNELRTLSLRFGAMHLWTDPMLTTRSLHVIHMVADELLRSATRIARVLCGGDVRAERRQDVSIKLFEFDAQSYRSISTFRTYNITRLTADNYFKWAASQEGQVARSYIRAILL